MSQTGHLIYRLLEQFDTAKIYYTLRRVREDTVMIEAVVPGRRYEIEVFADETIEVEIFKSDGSIGGQELIDELLGDLCCHSRRSDRRAALCPPMPQHPRNS